MLFTEIETDRLILKNIGTDDRDFIFAQFSDDVVNRYLFDAEPLSDLQGADEIIAFYTQPEPRSQQRWILVRKTDGAKVGTCGFHCWNPPEGKVEVGYDLREAFWGNGYMQEAMQAILAFAREKMHVKKIDACIAVENQRSIRVVEKFGFVRSGSTTLVFRGREYPHHIYSLELAKSA
ncbi:acetyltransferase [Longilinea arvoryzae]|uniref:Acetyltransferase n=1 Tax=Longilinea arvoryzae TaxID=360412 RepID=A0A0S7BFM2_9CHLR|nr:GNAT family N-acetyltransferase [Longilinea arvoryzae]GAP12577.1 acetyltransferase [Longilinea arvoryzae]